MTADRALLVSMVVSWIGAPVTVTIVWWLSTVSMALAWAAFFALTLAMGLVIFRTILAIRQPADNRLDSPDARA